ncbi:MAG: alanine--tRNA ligase, partial [Verrucomicrobiae bacterium]|nr:alanine--tRNA ligase [Verrucomicrobiae bacterium]
FEMLGNWSFGNYFKKEAIAWAWELLTERWRFPAERLYATVYCPHMDQNLWMKELKSIKNSIDAGGQIIDSTNYIDIFQNDLTQGLINVEPSDMEAAQHWFRLFESAGLDPLVHIVPGNKKDNFWMMGDTGPCGPCSEVHIDLTPDGDTKGSLVNGDDARCIEIWNLVFIQYNAEADGTFRALPACHVDTGMGFERAASVIQCTNGFTDFSKLCSNYDTGVFKGIFAKLSELTGKTYTGTVPTARSGLTEQEQTDVAFRVIADHLRSGSFSIADGILPGNKGRNATIRAILRRAVRFGRELGLDGSEPFLPQLVEVLVQEFGDVFPELRDRQSKVSEELRREEVLFNRTLDRGLKLFEEDSSKLQDGALFPADRVVKLWETYGFPIELTKVLLDERGLSADWSEVNAHIDKHKETGKGGGGTTVIRAVSIDTDVVSEFVGYEQDEVDAELLEVVEDGEAIVAIVSKSPLYVEMGGQQGDVGWLTVDDEEIEVLGTTSVGAALCLVLEKKPATTSGSVKIQLDPNRRRDIEKHHTATHLLHWALHENVNKDAAQQGSFVAPDRLRFDCNSDAISADQIDAIEQSVNRCVANADQVSSGERPYTDVKGRADVMQFFGDKYGEKVRVVQIGGEANALNGYSMELCGGTHVRNTSEIGLFKIRSEGAIAAGIRRIEAVCGPHAVAYLNELVESLDTETSELSAKLDEANAGLVKLDQSPVSAPARDTGARDTILAIGSEDAGAISKLNAALKAEEQWRDALKEAMLDAQKMLKKAKTAGMSRIADEKVVPLIEAAPKNADGIPVIVAQIDDGEGALLQELFNSLKKHQFSGAAVLVVPDENGTVHLGTYVDKAHTGEIQAGKLIQQLGPLIGGKGGGKPEMARGAGNDPSGIPKLLDEATKLLGCDAS